MGWCGSRTSVETLGRPAKESSLMVVNTFGCGDNTGTASFRAQEEACISIRDDKCRDALENREMRAGGQTQTGPRCFLLRFFSSPRCALGLPTCFRSHQSHSPASATRRPPAQRSALPLARRGRRAGIMGPATLREFANLAPPAAAAAAGRGRSIALRGAPFLRALNRDAAAVAAAAAEPASQKCTDECLRRPPAGRAAASAAY